MESCRILGLYQIGDYISFCVSDCDLNSTVQDGYRMAAGSRSLEDIYRQQESAFGLGPFITYPSTTEERDLQRLIYCTKFLPSPIFKMEHLMPTNREAQRKYLPWPWDEEEPKPTSSHLCEDLKEEEVKKEEGEAEEREEEQVQEDHEEEDKEEEDKEEEDKEEEDNEVEHMEVDEKSDNEDEEEESVVEEKEEEEVEKTVKEQEETKEEVSMAMRRIQCQTGRRKKIRQHSFLHDMMKNIRGKRNIIWTILLRPMRR
ncbi:uncharacterized protein LOC142730625 [Rhinoderma darwinii]|uniref:uncharacterized protein LOC142730625 n=1 Tax=Rhinoderma darwinii TaxID=43563 RepID=UPI003F66F1F5